MLLSLLIKNYAIIESAELNFVSGLNIITGETGAGKSILIGALQLILGKRADLKVLYNKDKKCFVEGTFDVSQYKLKSLFDKYELEYDDEMIVRREINASGKSRAFVNDTPVKLSILSLISSQLIDLHQQFDTLEIHDADTQIKLLDTVSGNEKLFEKYSHQYKEYLDAESDYTNAIQKINEGKKEIDYIKFQLEEFEAIKLVGGEQTNLEQELSSLEHAEEIQAIVGEVTNKIEQGEQTILSDFSDFSRQLGKISNYNENINALLERLITVSLELSDISQELIAVAEETEISPTRLDEVKSRVDTIYRLQNKHGVQSVEELISISNNLAETFSNYSNSEEYIAKLQKRLTDLKTKANSTAEQLSAKRKQSTKKIEKNVKKMLAELAMEDAVLSIQINQREQLSKHGIDDVEFLFSANKGSTPIALKKVASGGELSRLNLSLKALVADRTNLPSLVFDEIDTGISGEVAQRMGHILAKLGSAHQVIVITHSPQVAARGHKHLFVYKETRAKETHTYIQELDQEGRIVEIAKMLSGNPPSESALLNAKELMDI